MNPMVWWLIPAGATAAAGVWVGVASRRRDQLDETETVAAFERFRAAAGPIEAEAAPQRPRSGSRPRFRPIFRPVSRPGSRPASADGPVRWPFLRLARRGH